MILFTASETTMFSVLFFVLNYQYAVYTHYVFGQIRSKNYKNTLKNYHSCNIFTIHVNGETGKLFYAKIVSGINNTGGRHYV